MARTKRNWHPNGYYHIIVRGNNRQNIFIDHIDMTEYYRILTSAYYKYNFEVYAYCIMTNHVHLLLRSPQVNLGVLMRYINKRYSDYYRKRHNFIGQIYQNRYFSKEIHDPLGILIVSAYIHRNPIETTTPMVKKLENYHHSSYPTYFHNKSSDYPFSNVTLLPKLLKSKQIDTPYAEWCLLEYQAHK